MTYPEGMVRWYPLIEETTAQVMSARTFPATRVLVTSTNRSVQREAGADS